MQAKWTPPTAPCWPSAATFLLAATMGKERAGRPVEKALAQRRLVRAALGQLEAELADRGWLLGYSPQFVDRLLADLKH